MNITQQMINAVIAVTNCPLRHDVHVAGRNDWLYTPGDVLSCLVMNRVLSAVSDPPPVRPKRPTPEPQRAPDKRRTLADSDDLLDIV